MDSEKFFAMSNITEIVEKAKHMAENRDIFYWATAKTWKKCKEAILCECIHSEGSLKVSNRCKNETARRAYLLFKNFDVGRSTESSFQSATRLDAITSSILYGLQHETKGRRPGNSSQSAIAARENFRYFTFFASLPKQKCRQRRDRKPLDTIRSFKRYMASVVR